jgi:hypothetical protein
MGSKKRHPLIRTRTRSRSGRFQPGRFGHYCGLQGAAKYFARHAAIVAQTENLPYADQTIDLDPEVRDQWGLPAPRLKNPERFLKGAIQELLADPRVYAQEHVSANKKYVNSFSPDWTCCGYWNTRKYVYRVNVPAMYMFVPPDVLDSQGKPSKTMRPPIIWADVSDRTLKDAKKIAFDPRKDQPEKGPEVDLIFTVTLDLIDRYMDTKTNKWVDLDAQFWKNVKAEAP